MTKRKVKPLDEIKFIGKEKREGEPFPVSRQKGLYFYVFASHVNQLIEINEKYKSLYKKGVKPLEDIRIIGRGGISGFRPFMLRGCEGEYVCVLADHLRQLMEINETYRELKVEIRKKIEERKGKEEEEQKKLEAERKRKAEERLILKKRKLEKRKKAMKAVKKIRKGIEETEVDETLKYVPEMKQSIREFSSEIGKAFTAEEYDKVVELVSKTQKTIERAKKEALKRIEELKKVPKPEGKYAYCLIESDSERIDFGKIGIDNTLVYAIPHRDIAVVVSDLPLKEYEVTEFNVTKHEDVIRRVMQDHTVIPMTFGMVFKNKEVLLSIVEGAYRAIKESLRLLDNKVELGIKAILTKEASESLNEKKEFMEKYVPFIFDSLSKYAVRAVKGKLFSDRLILNASFLVEKDKIEQFSEEVGKIGEKNNDLKIQYSGPWAPYHFVNINIGGKRG